jgi:hypothetical protein
MKRKDSSSLAAALLCAGLYRYHPVGGKLGDSRVQYTTVLVHSYIRTPYRTDYFAQAVGQVRATPVSPACDHLWWVAAKKTPISPAQPKPHRNSLVASLFADRRLGPGLSAAAAFPSPTLPRELKGSLRVGKGR